MAGQDVTEVADPTESYQRFITVDAEQAIGEQHHAIRRMFRECEERPWSEWNADAFGEWLGSRNRDR